MRLRVWGHDPIDEWLESRRQVIELYEKHGATQILVDAREQESAPGVLDVFDFGEDWPQGVRAAILVSEDTPQDTLFLEAAAANSGRSIRMFFDENEALRWLGT